MDILTKKTVAEVQSVNFCNQELKEKSGDEKNLQCCSICECHQNVESSSKDEDSARKAEASVLRWLYKVTDGISALSEDYPIYIETPDWMNLIQRSLPLSGHEDSCGHDGHNYEDYQGENYRSKEPCFEDGTWMIVRIRIPQTILDLQHHQP